MAFHRFIAALDAGDSLTVYDDGRQTRDFTHVSDVVSAVIRAADVAGAVGSTYNIAGGSRVSLHDSLACLADIMERKLVVSYEPKQAGDVRDTYADIHRAQKDLGYQPSVGLREGLIDEVSWYRAVAAGRTGSVFI
jgi:nucleoside-diphosphate-sugar epimerase